MVKQKKTTIKYRNKDGVVQSITFVGEYGGMYDELDAFPEECSGEVDDMTDKEEQLVNKLKRVEDD